MNSPSHRPHRRLPVLLALMTLGAITSLAGPAAAIPPGGAGDDTPGTSSSVSPRQVTAGARISFTVSGFPAGETLYVKIDDGTACSSAAVHGACVYHQQKIPSSGTVRGSFALPGDLPRGAHWLRFLASEPVVKDGAQIGVKGFTNRGDSDFTVVAAGTGATSGGSAGSPGSSDGSSDGSSSSDGAATPETSGNTSAGGVVAVTPGATADPTAPSPTTTTDDVTAPDATAAAEADESSDFPWIGVAGFAGLVALSFAGARLAASRRR